MAVFIFALLGAVIAAGLGVLGNWLTRPSWAEDHPGRVLVAIAALALAGGGVAAVSAAVSGQPSASTTVVSTSTAVGQPPSTSVTTPSTSTALPTSLPPPLSVTTPPPAAPPQYLSDLDFVDRGRSGPIHTGAYSANGTQYTHSVEFENFCNNVDGGDIWAEYNLGRAFSRFEVTVGINDEDPAEAAGTFRVLVDGVEKASGAISLGTSVPVQIDVSDALRLRLEVNNPRAARSCREPGIHEHTIWGDARLS